MESEGYGLCHGTMAVNEEVVVLERNEHHQHPRGETPTQEAARLRACEREAWRDWLRSMGLDPDLLRRTNLASRLAMQPIRSSLEPRPCLVGVRGPEKVAR